MMRDQLKALLTVGRESMIRVQVLPLDADPHLFIEYAVSILTSPTRSTVVCVETYHAAGIIEDAELVDRAVRAYDDVVAEALSARDSAALIRERLESL